MERIHDVLPVLSRSIVSRVLKPELDLTFKGFVQAARSWLSSNESNLLVVVNRLGCSLLSRCQPIPFLKLQTLPRSLVDRSASQTFFLSMLLTVQLRAGLPTPSRLRLKAAPLRLRTNS
jgi:hypothetical protein